MRFIILQSTCAWQVPYKVLPKEELQKQRKRALHEVMSVLEVPEDVAMRVLRKYKWDVSRVQEEWFSKYEQVRQSLGLVDEEPTPSGREERCLICFDSYPLHEMRSAACKHYFCKECWRGYISNALSSGPACLDLRCPSTECKGKACVPSCLIMELASPDDKAKYASYMIRSYVEDNNAMSWCTGKNCENAIECLVDRAPGEPLDVLCTCSATFCFNCKEEAHRPVSCETVTKWLTKNSAESENMNWILANTKPCPKCSRPIEKNQGCMHMTCSQCRFEFCWLCQGDWKEHGERTGGFYACNRFETAKKRGDYDDESRRRENAKASLERYMHYFERFDAHSKAREKARTDASKVSKEWLDHLADITKTPTSQLKFINEAWNQIVECRRQLKWTYAYGYYAFENADKDAENARHKTFFEFLQGDAERSLERLHEAAEKDLGTHVQKARNQLDGGFDVELFQNFRKNLIGLTDVTAGFFDKLVKQLEKGFGSMEADYAGQVGLGMLFC
ncbi:hypothetical protein VOLCADRAFT_59371 [Volvox carteri f. nagariensis]|uniref:RBR-type E3 ubiquitin transferase n=1 Tax=Volvox carteri f. nagariensis TaxID=3068 RepID=D8TT05_VOLCA|nr:uncharacterized protein VOLCADRAFT_59371 [Volvox carteri f. nagariensis]EFJ49570.1 hypothetical protein VOLCADRAFT_59371 [Volvox carteri f. nagariensis]|eukprot:XP_002949551.1 hypothetical protein VOLCADRAFT_59371 [Volvox carteri f. nagariensis]